MPHFAPARLLLALLILPSAGMAEEAIDYAKQIKPILATRCYRCHSSLGEEGGLRLDSAAALLKGGDGGAIVVPGKSGESRLLAAVRKTGELHMPPEGAPLTAEQIDLLARWVDAGAKVPPPEAEHKIDHWSFRKPVRPQPPQKIPAEWSHNPIDAFIAAEHAAKKLSPVELAPPNLLLRRVYLDLIGIPPTPEQLREFLRDPSPVAYDRVVNQLLDSPQYGERWGRHWMDVWRYSDWDGYGAEIRESKPHIWRWRDWIVESLNADKPYDRMLTEMLAADELFPDDQQALRATGFLVRNWYKFNRNVWLDSTVEHTGKAFLGVTFNCARCHDHMYDPMAQTEYYQLRAFFEPLDFRTDRIPGQADVVKDGLVRAYDAKADSPTFLFARGNEKDPVKDKPLAPGVPRFFTSLALPPVESVSFPPPVAYPGLATFVRDEIRSAAEADLQTARDSLPAAQAKLAAELPKAGQALPVDPAKPAPPAVPPGLVDAELQAELARLSVVAAESQLAFVRAREAADSAAHSSPPAANSQELALAAGAAERTAAVAIAEKNLVQTEMNLIASLRSKDGKTTQTALNAAINPLSAARALLGKPHSAYTKATPVYPAASSGRRSALAGFIASRDNPLTPRVAINHLWLRHFGAPLVPTVFDFGLNGKPPTHPELLDWLAVEFTDHNWSMKHIHRLLVSSRTYRLHSTAGKEPSGLVAANRQLDPENNYLWRFSPRRLEAEAVRDATLSVAGSLDLTRGGPDLDPAAGLTLPRRSLYFRTSKEKKMTFLSLFDSANVTECYRRSESVAPQQALAMANSPLTLAQARILAKKLIDQAGKENSPTDTFLSLAFETILCREPTAGELLACRDFLSEQAAALASPASLSAFTAGPAAAVPPSADPTQRARENLVHVLLNHHDFVTMR